MALDDLLRTLEQEAEARIAGIRARAADDAERIRRQGEADLVRRRAAELGAREAELRGAATRAIEAARGASTRQVLEARADVLARVRRRARERLAARANDPALLPLLRQDLRRAMEYVDPAGAVVEAPAALLDELTDVDRPEGLSVRPAPQPRAGIVLRSADGAVTVDATLESRLEREWPRTAVELVRRLEAER